MLKDRKFWTGMILGLAIAGSVSLIQPLYAVGPANDDGAFHKAVAAALLKLVKSSDAMQKDLADIKASANSIDKGVTALKDTANLATPAPR